LTSQGHPRTIFKRALEHDNLVLAEVTAREIGRVTIAEALELTALVARKQPDRYGRFAARWLCVYLEEHEQATLEDVEVLVSNLRSLATRKDRGSALAILRKAARGLTSTPTGWTRLRRPLASRGEEMEAALEVKSPLASAAPGDK
jgi:hypothetical protein